MSMPFAGMERHFEKKYISASYVGAQHPKDPSWESVKERREEPSWVSNLLKEGERRERLCNGNLTRWDANFKIVLK
jgi:hypothetical protein